MTPSDHEFWLGFAYGSFFATTLITIVWATATTIYYYKKDTPNADQDPYEEEHRYILKRHPRPDPTEYR
jgi:hypothetical protein